MSDDFVVPDHCSVCDKEPTVGLNDVVFCDDHAAEGFAAIAREMAIMQGITEERRIVAMERAMVRAYREANETDLEVGDTISFNTAQYGDDAN